MNMKFVTVQRVLLDKDKSGNYLLMSKSFLSRQRSLVFELSISLYKYIKCASLIYLNLGLFFVLNLYIRYW